MEERGSFNPNCWAYTAGMGLGICGSAYHYQLACRANSGPELGVYPLVFHCTSKLGGIIFELDQASVRQGRVNQQRQSLCVGVDLACCDDEADRTTLRIGWRSVVWSWCYNCSGRLSDLVDRRAHTFRPLARDRTIPVEMAFPKRSCRY